jgi:hypothetical protein
MAPPPPPVVGAGVTVTVTEAGADVPPGPVQAIVKVVVVVSGPSATELPELPCVPDQPPEAVHPVLAVEVHVSRTPCPDAIVVRSLESVTDGAASSTVLP